MTMTPADSRDPQAKEAGDLLADPPTRRRGGLAGGLALWMGLCLAIVGFIASAIGVWVVDRHHRQAIAEAHQRLDVRADGKADVLQAWLAGLTQLAGNLVNNDQFRLFATEMDIANPDDPLYGQLAPLAPYMLEALSEFVRQNPVSAAYLVGRDGRPVLASAGAAEPTEAQQSLAAEAVASGQIVLSPIRRDAGIPVFDLHRPIPALQGNDPFTQPEPVGVLMVTVPAAERLSALLEPATLDLPGERSIIVQLESDERMTAWYLSATGLAGDGVASLGPAGGQLLDQGVLLFAERRSLAGDQAVLSAGLALPGVRWSVIQELDLDTALAPVARTRLLAVVLGALATLAIAGSFAAVWFRLQGAHLRELAAQYRDMAGRIDANRRLLTGVTDTVGELIGLKRRDGSYAYVNRTLAEAVGRDPAGVVGQTDDCLFGHATAERLAIADRAAWAGQRPPAVEEIRYLAGRRRHLETTRVPLIRPDGAVDGIVSVSRDVTDLVEERQRREAAVRQTVDVLVRTVELSDPYLAGHSRLLRDVAGLVARRLALGGADITTVEIAATLSQIGKPQVPRDILTKPERLSAEEIEVMQTHIIHAVRVLDDIDFDVPVRETVAQLYERLDGSGYPNALAGEAIALPARILGICDWFCARIRPRSYRTAIAPKEAVRILAAHPDKYDAAAVDALAGVIATPDGEKLLAGSRAA